MRARLVPVVVIVSALVAGAGYAVAGPDGGAPAADHPALADPIVVAGTGIPASRLNGRRPRLRADRAIESLWLGQEAKRLGVEAGAGVRGRVADGLAKGATDPLAFLAAFDAHHARWRARTSCPAAYHEPFADRCANQRPATAGTCHWAGDSSVCHVTGTAREWVVLVDDRTKLQTASRAKAAAAAFAIFRRASAARARAERRGERERGEDERARLARERRAERARVHTTRAARARERRADHARGARERRAERLRRAREGRAERGRARSTHAERARERREERARRARERRADRARRARQRRADRARRARERRVRRAQPELSAAMLIRVRRACRRYEREIERYRFGAGMTDLGRQARGFLAARLAAERRLARAARDAIDREKILPALRTMRRHGDGLLVEVQQAAREQDIQATYARLSDFDAAARREHRILRKLGITDCLPSPTAG